MNSNRRYEINAAVYRTAVLCFTANIFYVLHVPTTFLTVIGFVVGGTFLGSFLNAAVNSPE